MPTHVAEQAVRRPSNHADSADVWDSRRSGWGGFGCGVMERPYRGPAGRYGDGGNLWTTSVCFGRAELFRPFRAWVWWVVCPGALPQANLLCAFSAVPGWVCRGGSVSRPWVISVGLGGLGTCLDGVCGVGGRGSCRAVGFRVSARLSGSFALPIVAFGFGRAGARLSRLLGQGEAWSFRTVWMRLVWLRCRWNRFVPPLAFYRSLFVYSFFSIPSGRTFF